MFIALLLRRLHGMCRVVSTWSSNGESRRKRWLHVLVSGAGLLMSAAGTSPQLALTPASTEVTTRVWGMGLLPLDGAFRQFSGSLAYSQPDFKQCDVMLTVQAASLTMADPEKRDEFLSPDFLDAARFPTLNYRGSCSGAGNIEGTLAMRGISHALPLKLRQSDHRLTVEGDLDRRLWGMIAKPLLVGHTVRIRVIVRLP